MRLISTLVLTAVIGGSLQACAQQPLFVSAPGSPIAIGDSPALVALGYADGDEHLDIVVGHAATSAVSVLLGHGDGRFKQRDGDPTPLPTKPTEMAVGDLDGDGFLDVVIGNHDSYELVLLRGDGAGGFARELEHLRMREGEHPHTHGLRLADVNEDGWLDVLTVNHEDSDVSVALGDSSGGFSIAQGSPFGVGKSPYPPGVGDINGDGHVDAAVPSAVRSGRGNVTLLLGDGHGRFSAQAVQLRTAGPWYTAIGDVTGDGRAELVTTHTERPEVSVLTAAPGVFAMTELPTSPFRFGASAFSVSIADFDGDGNNDLAGIAGDVVAILLGDGTGGFRRPLGAPYAVGQGAWSMDVGDVNHDGRPDVVTGNADTGNISVLLSR